MPLALRFPLVLNNLPLDSIGCYGTWKSLFPYRKCRDGWDGMGWEGKGRDVMGWEWGWGEVRHVDKVGKIKRLAPTNHPQASLWRSFGFCGATCGTLGAPVCVPFYHLGGAGAFLGQSSKKIRKPNEHTSQNRCQKGCIFSLVVG